MSKYARLTDHLRATGRAEVRLTFDEIESIIRSDLPRSATLHRAWWSNNPTSSVMTKAWLAAGYKSAAVDMKNRQLLFRRVSDELPSGVAGVPERSGDAAATGTAVADQRIDAPANDISGRLADVLRELAELRERVAKLEGSVEGFLAGRRDRAVEQVGAS